MSEQPQPNAEQVPMEDIFSIFGQDTLLLKLNFRKAQQEIITLNQRIEMLQKELEAFKSC